MKLALYILVYDFLFFLNYFINSVCASSVRKDLKGGLDKGVINSTGVL